MLSRKNAGVSRRLVDLWASVSTRFVPDAPIFQGVDPVLRLSCQLTIHAGRLVGSSAESGKVRSLARHGVVVLDGTKAASGHHRGRSEEKERRHAHALRGMASARFVAENFLSVVSHVDA